MPSLIKMFFPSVTGFSNDGPAKPGTDPGANPDLFGKILDGAKQNMAGALNGPNPPNVKAEDGGNNGPGTAATDNPMVNPFIPQADSELNQSTVGPIAQMPEQLDASNQSGIATDNFPMPIGNRKDVISEKTGDIPIEPSIRDALLQSLSANGVGSSAEAGINVVPEDSGRNPNEAAMDLTGDKGQSDDGSEQGDREDENSGATNFDSLTMSMTNAGIPPIYLWNFTDQPVTVSGDLQVTGEIQTVTFEGHNSAVNSGNPLFEQTVGKVRQTSPITQASPTAFGKLGPEYTNDGPESFEHSIPSLFAAQNNSIPVNQPDFQQNPGVENKNTKSNSVQGNGNPSVLGNETPFQIDLDNTSAQNQSSLRAEENLIFTNTVDSKSPATAEQLRAFQPRLVEATYEMGNSVKPQEQTAQPSLTVKESDPSDKSAKNAGIVTGDQIINQPVNDGKANLTNTSSVEAGNRVEYSIPAITAPLLQTPEKQGRIAREVSFGNGAAKPNLLDMKSLQSIQVSGGTVFTDAVTAQIRPTILFENSPTEGRNDSSVEAGIVSVSGNTMQTDSAQPLQNGLPFDTVFQKTGKVVALEESLPRLNVQQTDGLENNISLTEKGVESKLGKPTEKNIVKEDFETSSLIQQTTVSTRAEQEKPVTQSAASSTVNRDDLFSQIMERVKVMIGRGHSEMEVHLKPDHLGKLQLRVAVENQVVTAQFAVESQRVKEIIETNLPQLRQQLHEQGIQADALTVSVGLQNNGSDWQHPSGQQSRPGFSETVIRGKTEFVPETVEQPVISRPGRNTLVDLIA